MIQLNLGCGTRKLPGFLNIDIRKDVKPDVVDDIITLCHIEEDSSVDLIYACHVLEHFEYAQVGSALSRWWNILKPGGVLRLSVPDMNAVFAHYFYWKNLEGIRGFLWGGQKNTEDYHKNGWDLFALKSELRRAGFDNIKEWDWKNTNPHNYIDDYSQIYWPNKKCTYDNNNVEVEGKLMSLNLEGVKIVNVST